MQYEYTKYSPQGLEMLELVILMMRVRQGYKMELLKLEHILQQNIKIFTFFVHYNEFYLKL